MRTLIALREEKSVFFMYGFAKNSRANISAKELKALILLAEQLLSYTPLALSKALRAKELVEVLVDEEA